MRNQSNTIRSLLVLLLVLMLAFTGCTAQAGLGAPGPEPGSPANPDSPPAGVPAPGNLTDPPFAIPVRGSFNEKLAVIQQELAEQNLLHGEVIEDASSLQALIARYHLESLADGQNLAYDDSFFAENALIMVYGQQGSSSLGYLFEQIQDNGALIGITLLRIDPEFGTTDMVLHGYLVEISRENLVDENGQLKALNITERALPAPSTEDDAPRIL